MKIKQSPARKAFLVIDYIVLTLVMLLSLFPLIHIFALSLSSNSAAQAGWVTFFPIGFNLDSYSYILSKPEFFKAFGKYCLTQLTQIILLQIFFFAVKNV